MMAIVDINSHKWNRNNHHNCVANVADFFAHVYPITHKVINILIFLVNYDTEEFK